MIDFLIIGGQRCGSTSMWANLYHHPQCFAPRQKEIHYFDVDKRYKTIDYESFFEHHEGVLHFEASPNYIFYPKACTRIKADYPDTKFIVVLRNPVDRAWSHYGLAKHFGWTRKSFEANLEEEDRIFDMESLGRLPASRFAHCCFKTTGHYAEQLERWFTHFDREQFFILKTSELVTRFNEVTRWLGIRRLRTRGHHANRGGGGRMKPKTWKYLNDYFRPHNEHLSDLLGGEWWT